MGEANHGENEHEHLKTRTFRGKMSQGKGGVIERVVKGLIGGKVGGAQ